MSASPSTDMPSLELTNVDAAHVNDKRLSLPQQQIEQQQWRVYGQNRRRWLVENDTAAAETTAFRMNAACSIHKYFALADRVILQFQDLCNRNAMEDAYVMGHRLINFLNAVSKHPAYPSTSRKESTEQNLAWILQKMQHIAFAIDEEQLNLYITNDFDPDIPEDDEDEDDDYDSTSACSHGSDEQPLPLASQAWESFAGWSLSPFEKPEQQRASDTDESSQDIDEDQLVVVTSPMVRKLPMEDSAGSNDDNDAPYHLDDPELEVMSDDEDDEDEYDDDYEQDDYGRHRGGGDFIYDVESPMVATSILKKIARERVRYETDSEAADSWAQSSTQDGDGAVSEAASSSAMTAPDAVGLSMSCDPARIAFREIMNRHSEQLNLLQLEMDRLQQRDPILPSQETTCVEGNAPFSAPLMDSGEGSFCRSAGDGGPTVSVFQTLTLEQEHERAHCTSPPPPPPPTNSPEEAVALRKQVQQPRDVRYIGFSTHAGIRRLA